MTSIQFLEEFRIRGESQAHTKDQWYTVAAVSLAAAGAGPDVTLLYQMATAGTSLDEEKRIQRRLKEAILKTSILYGVPRSLQTLLPLFATLDDEHIDHYGPRTNALKNGQIIEERQTRARKYFDTLWTPAAAQANREKNFKYQPDLYLLNLQTIYELWISEDTILSPVETQMCNVGALVCSGSPVQAMWHARGVVRHGGTIEQTRFAQDIALAVGKAYGYRMGEVIPVHEIPFDDTAPH
ncbi:hypothetical protein FE257_002074 [Aspergillus nanangensis]|uniref:Carboxymuconolactone decarboxylase-like domain-containing protein n=1 Tax=Aspergillus nanangensis TaxID=2582783 RepID=A0AAD4CTP9_ASPNN|nr:hypothetical protein FE257_002074 [Aspergillus nanangensis]